LVTDSIFQRSDGVLFLYEEVNEVLAAAAAAAQEDTVSARWQQLMNPYLDRDWEWNGPLEHVMYMDPDPATRSMAPIEPSSAMPSLEPNQAWGEYDSFTGGGGWSLSGRSRQAQQLKCRVEGIPEYNRWHAQVWPELQVLGFRGGSRNYSIFQRKDGLLFLYSETDEAVAEKNKSLPPPPANDVNERWQAMMNEVGLERDYPGNGPLEHVMYIGDDRTMTKP
jgi:L-rhamnose mutarotase